MTIYEQIEAAVEITENAIAGAGRADGAERAITHAAAARSAGMGERSFRTWFQAVTGYTWREYVVRRRLAEAAGELETSDKPIVDIAMYAGYESHEAFTRSFAEEYSVSPREYRKRGGAMDPTLPRRFEKIRLYKELYMGVIVKELNAMRAAYFDGFQPNAEDKAMEKLNAWRAGRPSAAKGRVFGHNINADGSICYGQAYAGYRFYSALAEGEDAGGAPTVTLEEGTFVVTGIEGNFENDPTGAWIGAGWQRMNEMVKEKGYRVKSPARWFEEALEPTVQGNMRLDLYLEIER